MQVYLILALIFALLVAFFAIQNTTAVIIQFLFWKFELSLVLIILGSAAAGALLLFFFGLFKQYSYHREKKSLINQRDDLQNELLMLNKKIQALENISTESPALNLETDTNQIKDESNVNQ